MIEIDVINESTCVSDADVEKYVAAFQVQVSRDFAPVWGCDAKLAFVPKGSTPNPANWLIVFLDHTDSPGAAGYHDETPAGLPIGKIFAKDTLEYGCSVSVDFTHEGCEMLVDPEINDVMSDSSGMVLRAKEVADACEDDKYAYKINDVLVTDFVTPEWFSDGPHPAGTKFDFLGHISKPCEILDGGYIGKLDLNNLKAGWQDDTSDGHDVASKKQPGSRYWRRRQKALPVAQSPIAA